MKLLHIDSSILGDASVSRALSAAVVAKLTAERPATDVLYRDLAADPLPHFSGATLGAMLGGAGDIDPKVQEDVAISGTVMDEFLGADVVVIGVAFYNFTVATQLKTWIDRLLMPGKTFRYTAEGKPEGLVGDKRLILAIARGGIYSAGSPNERCEHAETYLRAIFGYIGITNPDVVVAEGLRVSPEQRVAGIDQAHAEIAALAA